MQILLIEDDPNHAELVSRSFEDQGSSAQITIVRSVAEAKAVLRTCTPDLIIADWRLPDGESLELLKTPCNDHLSPPMVIMTSYGNERTAVNAIKSGALDYVVKSSETMMDMPHLAERAISQWQMMNEREQMRRALQESESQFRLLAENSSDIIARMDAEGKILYISPACRTLIGYEPEQLVGKQVQPLIHINDLEKIDTLVGSDLLDTRTEAVPFRALCKNGEYTWLEATLRVIRDRHTHKISEVQASVRDISSLLRAHSDLQEAYERTMEGWVRALDLRDHETEGHTQRVKDLTMQLARRLGFSEVEMVNITRGALLHDIGKLAIPDEILLKRGPLNEEEWRIMRRHPSFAFEMLAPIRYLSDALVIPYYHHERWDGSGYPQGLKGKGIPLEARLFAVVDVWDALSSDRVYRKKCTEEYAREYLVENKGILFDPEVVDLFLKMLQEL